MAKPFSKPVRGGGKGFAVHRRVPKGNVDPTSKRFGQQGRRLRLFVPPNGPVLRFPWIPDEIEVSNLGRAWDELPRPGRLPLLVSSGRKLPKVNIPLRLTSSNRTVSWSDEIKVLDDLANSKRVMRLDFGGKFRGLYRISDLTIRERDWNREGQITEASIDLELTRASDVEVSIGPVRKKPEKPAKKPASKRGRTKRRAKRK